MNSDGCGSGCRGIATAVLVCFLVGTKTSWAVELPEPPELADGLPLEERQDFNRRREETAQERTRLLSWIERHNTDCSDVPGSDTGRIQHCREEEQQLKAEIEAYANAWGALKEEIASASSVQNVVQREEDEFNQMQEVWLRRQEDQIREAARQQRQWTEEVMAALESIEVPSPFLYRPKTMRDLRPGDILLVTPEGKLGRNIVRGDFLIRATSDLADGRIFKGAHSGKAPVSHALTFVKSVNGKLLFLDHTKEGSRILDEKELLRKYGHRGAFVARPQVLVDGRILWEAARTAALEKKSDFGLLGRNAVCSERAAWAVARATGLPLENGRLGPVDVTPGDFFDPEGTGVYFLVSPLDEWQ